MRDDNLSPLSTSKTNINVEDDLWKKMTTKHEEQRHIKVVLKYVAKKLYECMK
jgi:hypothetical protein